MKLPAWMNHPVVRKILNLEPVPDPGTKPEQAPAAQPAEKPPAPGAGENPQDTAEFFTPIPTKPTIGQRIFRILAFSVLILLVWIGVRTVIWGNQSRQAAAPSPTRSGTCKAVRKRGPTKDSSLKISPPAMAVSNARARQPSDSASRVAAFPTATKGPHITRKSAATAAGPT